MKAADQDAFSEGYKRGVISTLALLANHSTPDSAAAWIWAIAFEVGVAQQMTAMSSAAKSKELGITRSYMSYLRKKFRESYWLEQWKNKHPENFL
jgi:hypothetical protein